MAMNSNRYQGHFTLSLYDNLLMKNLLMDASEKNMKQIFNIKHFNTIIIHVHTPELMLHSASGSDQI